MDKLSSILPSSARTRSVDMSDSKPVRPGAPVYGEQKVGTTSVKDRVSIGQALKTEMAKDTMTYKNPREVSRAKMVEELNAKFFDTRLEGKTKPEDKEISLEMPKSPSTEASDAISIEDFKVSAGSEGSLPAIEAEVANLDQ